MADDAARLKAVLDAPDDDAPRLAYARWIEEQGDAARGELIRAQIDLAHRDWQEVRTGLASGAQHRIKQLTDRHGRSWAGALADWVEAFSFVRGFVGWIKISARNF